MALSKLDCHLLALIRARPRSGYDVKKILEAHAPYNGYVAQASQIYRALARFVDQEWVDFIVDPRDDAPAAKVYSLTAAGQAAFSEWATSPYEPVQRPMDPEFHLRFALGGLVGPDVALRIVEIELDFRRRQALLPIGYMSAYIASDASASDRQWQADLTRLSHGRGYTVTQSFITWLELTRQHLRALVDENAGASSDGFHSIPGAVPTRAGTREEPQ